MRILRLSWRKMQIGISNKGRVWFYLTQQVQGMTGVYRPAFRPRPFRSTRRKVIWIPA
jgi:hypothetical protein